MQDNNSVNLSEMKDKDEEEKDFEREMADHEQRLQAGYNKKKEIIKNKLISLSKD